MAYPTHSLGHSSPGPGEITYYLRLLVFFLLIFFVLYLVMEIVKYKINLEQKELILERVVIKTY